MIVWPSIKCTIIDMDALGHVNNVTCFRYFENARVAYFERIKMMEFMTGVRNRTHPCLDSVQVSSSIGLSWIFKTVST